MKKYIAIFTCEFNSVNLHGFQLMSEKQMDSYIELAESIIWDITFELGDDKELYFSDGLELLSNIEFNEVTNEEYKAISRTFVNGEFGTFIDKQFLDNLVEEEEETQIDDDDEDGYRKEEDDDEY